MWKLVVHGVFFFFTILPLIPIFAEKRYDMLGMPIFLGLLWIGFAWLTHTPSVATIERRMDREEAVAEVARSAEPPPAPGKMRITLETKASTRDAVARGPFTTDGKITEYTVYLTTVFSEETRAILNKHRLWDVVMLSQDYYMPPDEAKKNPLAAQAMTEKPLDITIKDLLRATGFHWTFLTPIDAKNFENKLRNDVLPRLKKYIDDSGAVAVGSPDTFEL